MSTRTAARVGFTVVACIRVCGQDHAACPVRGSVVGVCCTVVEEFIDFGAGVFCCSCLRCSYGAESHLKFVVDSSGVV